jgi:hypothetical protein
MKDYQDYINAAVKTESVPATVHFDKNHLDAILNTYVHMTEILDQAKKNIFYGKDIDEDKLKFDLSRIQHYLSFVRDLANRPFEVNHVDLDLNVRITHGIIGKATESGELVSQLVNQLNGKELDIVNIGEELADDEWYTAIICDETKLNKDNILEANIEKLKKRYNDKFSADAAINRDVVEERKVLEAEIQVLDTESALDDISTSALDDISTEGVDVVESTTDLPEITSFYTSIETEKAAVEAAPVKTTKRKK